MSNHKCVSFLCLGVESFFWVELYIASWFRLLGSWAPGWSFNPESATEWFSDLGQVSCLAGTWFLCPENGIRNRGSGENLDLSKYTEFST